MESEENKKPRKQAVRLTESLRARVRKAHKEEGLQPAALAIKFNLSRASISRALKRRASELTSTKIIKPPTSERVKFTVGKLDITCDPKDLNTILKSLAH